LGRVFLVAARQEFMLNLPAVAIVLGAGRPPPSQLQALISLVPGLLSGDQHAVLAAASRRSLATRHY
jgi:hypothetical protein